MATTSGFWTRIGDHALGFGMKRYVTDDGDKKPLWRFYITRQPHTPLLEIDASGMDLQEIIRQCERGIAALATDGGRNKTDVDDAAKAA